MVTFIIEYSSLRAFEDCVETWNWTRATVHGRAPFTWPICLFPQWQILRYLHPFGWLRFPGSSLCYDIMVTSLVINACNLCMYGLVSISSSSSSSSSSSTYKPEWVSEWVSSNQQTFSQHHHHYFECLYGLWLSDMTTITHENWRCSLFISSM